MISFNDSFKARVFDKIAAEYFDRNFGSLSKSDLETLLFSEYIEYLMDMNEPFDDYSLSKQLGITQSRVSALKERKELKYPIGSDYWEKAFARAVKNARIDNEKNRIIIPIEDVNVRIEVRHFIEKMGWFDEYQLNRKLLTITFECFSELCTELNGENVFTQEALKKIKSLSKKYGAGKVLDDFVKDFTVDGLKSFASEASKQLLLDVLALLPFGGTAKLIVTNLSSILEKI